MSDRQAREAAHEAFGGLISTDWANASEWEREEVRRSVDAAIDAYLAKMREQMPDPADMYPDIPADPDHFPTGWSRAEERDAYRLGFTDGRVTLSAQQPDHSALIARLRSEANIADRPGQMDRLNAVADALEGKTDE